MARSPGKHKFTETEIIFRKNLIYLREKSGHTRYSITKELKINHAYYYKMEDFRIPLNPTFEYMETIAQFYNLEVWQLFTKLYEQEKLEKK